MTATNSIPTPTPAPQRFRIDKDRGKKKYDPRQYDGSSIMTHDQN